MKETAFPQIGSWTNAPSEPQPYLGQHILVADDDPLTRRLNSEVLVYSGYKVDTAEDGATAWNALLVNNYDLLVTDNDMPKATGVVLLKKVHATRMALPVIMATGKMPDWEFSEYPWLQPAAVLSKPHTIDELLAAVKEVLHTTAVARGEAAPRLNWYGRLISGDLRP